MEIYLVRHTAVNNPDRRCYGQSDIALKENWQSDFEDLKIRLGESVLNNATFYSSPYQRCTRLASFLSQDRYQIDSRLSEMNFGEWEQQAWTDIDQSVLNEWMGDYVNYHVPAGESFVELYARCTQFWDDLLLFDRHSLCIVSHAGVIRSLIARLLQIPLNKIFQLDIDYGSITRITINKQNSDYAQVNYINR